MPPSPSSADVRMPGHHHPQGMGGRGVRARRASGPAKVAVVVATIAGLIAAQQMGFFQLFAEPVRVKQALVELGPWGYGVFVLAYATLQPFGVPGTVFILAAPLVWPWPLAFGVSMVGTMAASVIGFSFARFVARDWVAQRVPARFRAYDAALAERGFLTVTALRFVFWMPPMLHAFFGISRVPFWTHFWGSAVGYFVPLLLTAYFGEMLFQAMRDAPTWLWFGAIAAAATVGATIWILRQRSTRRRR